LIDAIGAPLGFFVLALLIVETFLGAVVIGGQLDSEQKMYGLWAGVAMFLWVTLAVFLLVWNKPSNLTYDKQAHLIDRGKIPYGTKQVPVAPDKIFEPEQNGAGQ
jgi:hypothetical protein